MAIKLGDAGTIDHFGLGVSIRDKKKEEEEEWTKAIANFDEGLCVRSEVL